MIHAMPTQARRIRVSPSLLQIPRSRLPQAITVGSSNQYDRRSSFSNVGSCVDIFAPGTSITSAWNTSDSQLVSQNGTSMTVAVS